MQRRRGEPTILATLWDDNELGQKILEVLSDVTYQDPDHHFHRPFVTAYQLAILLKIRFPATFCRLGFPIGGRGTGHQETLARYIARELSRKIGNGELTEVIEGGFLSNQQLLRIEFDDEGETITSSSTDSQYDTSLFRLRAS